MGGKRKLDPGSTTDRQDRNRRDGRPSYGLGGVESEPRNPYGHTAAHLDPEYGQRGAFPGLNADGQDEDLFYGPADDGLQYLRMVR